MQRKKHFRFSLKSFLILCTTFGILFGISARDSYNHAWAKENLRKSGFDCYNSFEEPVGPNWIYGIYGVPGNGTFPYWFSSRFCCTGCYHYLITDMTPCIADMHSLKHLIALEVLQVGNSKMPVGWVAVLGECNYLKQLDIISTPLDREEIVDLSRLDVSSLGIFRSNIGSFDLFKSSVERIPSLLNLTLHETGLERFQIDELRKTMPYCEIDFLQELKKAPRSLDCLH